MENSYDLYSHELCPYDSPSAVYSVQCTCGSSYSTDVNTDPPSDHVAVDAAYFGLPQEAFDVCMGKLMKSFDVTQECPGSYRIPTKNFENVENFLTKRAKEFWTDCVGALFESKGATEWKKDVQYKKKKTFGKKDRKATFCDLFRQVNTNTFCKLSVQQGQLEVAPWDQDEPPTGRSIVVWGAELIDDFVEFCTEKKRGHTRKKSQEQPQQKKARNNKTAPQVTTTTTASEQQPT
eukprot:TRINITY_DN7600_c0_g1_i1.p1 TRINITY_DN7600_c0_g1~~TRINITY_DN7600_c0_g1_i1.p1  ORF type:complete len:235 (-),score=44.01 TRINITY_DN7600_c0_g1_i1:158-862(-)